MFVVCDWPDGLDEVRQQICTCCPRWERDGSPATCWLGPKCRLRQLGCVPRPDRAPVTEMIRSYEEATGTCIGCD